jgi:hypothetical protein
MARDSWFKRKSPELEETFVPEIEVENNIEIAEPEMSDELELDEESELVEPELDLEIEEPEVEEPEVEEPEVEEPEVEEPEVEEPEIEEPEVEEPEVEEPEVEEPEVEEPEVEEPEVESTGGLLSTPPPGIQPLPPVALSPESEPEPVQRQKASSLLSAAIGEVVSVPSIENEASTYRESQMLEFEEFIEPSTQENTALLNRKIEPCDITGAWVDVSRKRKLWRTLERSMANIRVSITGRLVSRAEFRFKDSIAQDEALSEVANNLLDWRQGQSHSLAWQFHEQVSQQLGIARQMHLDAANRISENHSYRNDKAHEIFGDFAKSTILPIIFGSYLYSVLVLTDNKFHSFLKYFPFFNQSRTEMAIIVTGFVSLSILAAAWRYTSKVREVQWKFVQAQRVYEDSVVLIAHAKYEEVRLEQQTEHVEPLLRVLANGYSSRWVIDESLEIDVSTKLNVDQLPGCFGFARAVDGSDEDISKLRDLAVRQVVRPGWRTEIIRKVGEKYGEKVGAQLTFTDLDRDLGISQYGARDLFLSALEDRELAKRVGRDKLIETVNVIHSDVLRNTQSDLRPPVLPTRNNGFENINASSEWLVDEDRTESWVEYLSAILKEAPPFSYLNLSETGLHGRINDGSVTSYAVVPKYLVGKEHESVRAEVVHDEIMAPIDIAVRVDVSEWGQLDSFGIFEPVEHQVPSFTQENGASGLRG